MFFFRCAKYLGEKHQHLATSLVPELLSTHPFFATAEPSVDDPAYIAIVILVFNATVNSPTMIAMFPDHTRRHYSYLRDSQPELVPHLDGIEQPRELEGYLHVDTGTVFRRCLHDTGSRFIPVRVCPGSIEIAAFVYMILQNFSDQNVSFWNDLIPDLAPDRNFQSGMKSDTIRSSMI